MHGVKENRGGKLGNCPEFAGDELYTFANSLFGNPIHGYSYFCCNKCYG